MSYLYLAFRYLFHDRKRTIWTIAGVTLVATVMYTAMWFIFSFLYYESSQRNFHIVVDSTDPALIQTLSADPEIRKIEVGSVTYLPQLADPSGDAISLEEWLFRPLLFLTLRDYNLKGSYSAELTETYHIRTAWVRDNPEEEQGMMYSLAYGLTALISFLASLPGVIMVRNAIQLSTMEQIRDYGNLRCIGGTKKQIRGILYLQGILEVSAGILSALLLSLILTGIANPIIEHMTMDSPYYRDGEMIFRIRVDIPSLLYVTFAFFFDLYFLLNENLKRVYGMTPAEAISGKYRFISKKIRPRKAFFIRKLFGIEGEYAYKSMMRNPSRIWKNVGILSISVAFIASALMGLGGHFNALYLMERQFPYFQICIDPGDQASGYTKLFNDVYLENELNSKSSLEIYKGAAQSLQSSPFITDSAPLYQKRMIASERVLDHLDPSVREGSFLGAVLQNENHEKNFKLHHSWDIRGFREEEKEAYQKNLIEGTLDVSENGLVLINGAYGESFYDSNHRDERDPYFLYSPFLDHLTTFRIGDSIQIPDPDWIEKQEILWITEEYNEERLKERFLAENPDFTDLESGRARFDFRAYERNLIADQFRIWYEEAIADGRYKTYRIEGILSGDPLFENMNTSPILLMPLDQYLTLTKEDEETGIVALNYHVSSPLLFGVQALGSVMKDNFSPYPVFHDISIWACSIYTDSIYRWAEGMAEPILLFVVVLLILVAFLFLAFINIRNATQNSIFLRKKELAQLYVIGCTNQTLGRMLRYEGVISGLISILFGSLLTIPAVLALKVWYGNSFYFENSDLPILWWLLPFSIGIASLLVVGFYALSVGNQSRKMCIVPASDLTSTGE